MKFVDIYVLLDPRDRRVRYVGRAADLSSRFSNHLREPMAEGNPKVAWIEELADMGLRPVLDILDRVPMEIAAEVEARWIAEYLEDGEPLLNTRGLYSWAALPVDLRLEAHYEDLLRQERELEGRLQVLRKEQRRVYAKLKVRQVRGGR